MRLLTVGRPTAPWWAQAVEDYRRRLQGPWALEWEAVREAPGRSEAGDDATRREGARLLERIRPRDWVVALDPAGEAVTSEELARRIVRRLEAGETPVFVVGGRWGLAEAVRRRADWIWSLSPLTFAHELAAAIVAEQLYRAWAIAHGHPYHHVRTTRDGEGER
ncbi:MAG: 23S rRNA (pseudouridine(1915)-N(3))-methyltransferase RlmH [Actinomycetia bacterium]|nr:23S rRNA (pseudouridine(1915)-N(3))-methyltransferase RlmH [Actinomycetes bacterium]